MTVESQVSKEFSVAKGKKASLPPPMYWTEVLQPSDRRARSDAMLTAKRDEMVSLIRRGTFKMVLLPNHHGENIIPSYFVSALKYTTTARPRTGHASCSEGIATAIRMCRSTLPRC